MSITTDPKEAYMHAFASLNGPFPNGEPVIATDSEYSYRYARDVLKAPFPAGEAAIRSDSSFSVSYDAAFPARALPATPACAHKFVNFGFASVTMACKYCGVDQS